MSCWKPYVPATDTPWNQERSVHLHRRAGFGATWTEIQRDLADEPQKAVSRLLNGTSRLEGSPDDFETLSSTIVRAAVNAGDAGRLKAWWIFCCLFSPDPLGERLTIMLHNHFATSVLKVKDLSWMLRQNQTFRKHARGEFQTLLAALLDDPALLTWLDATENRAGHPNENLSRELMELFSLGIGNYSERDVQEVTRALTGITFEDGVVQLDPLLHDPGSKTILSQSREFFPSDLPELLASQPAMSKRLAWRLCREFCGEDVVDPQAIEELAEGLRENRLRIGWAVETIVRSDLFFSESNLRHRVADPASFFLCPLRSLECFRDPPSTLALADALRRMGLDLFTPPNVGGWVGGRAWLSTRTVIARTNAVADFLQGRMHLPARMWDPLPLLTRHGVNGELPEVIRFLGRLLWGQIDDRTINDLVLSIGDEPDRSRQIRKALLFLFAQPMAQFH